MTFRIIPYICLYPLLLFSNPSGGLESPICDLANSKMALFQRFQQSLESSLGTLEHKQLLQPILEAKRTIDTLHQEIIEQSTSSCETIVAIRNAGTDQERQQLLKKTEDIRKSVDAHIPMANEAMNRVVLNHQQIKQALSDIKEQQLDLNDLNSQIQVCSGDLAARLEQTNQQVDRLRAVLETSLADSLVYVTQIESSFEEIDRRSEVVRVCEELARREVNRP